MNNRNYYSMFKNERDVLTVSDLIRLLRIGKNSVYKLLKEGKINSIKQGNKIIIPKVCLIEYLTDKKNYQFLSPVMLNNHWTYEETCDIVCLPQEKIKVNKISKGEK